MHGRELHQFILDRLEQRLGDRSWSWLARASGVPRTTLVTQASRRRFSVEVLVKVATALDEDVGHFLPSDDRASDRAEAEAALRRLKRFVRELDRPA